MHLFQKLHWARKARRIRDYPCQRNLDTLKCCYILVCSIVKEGIVVVRSAAYNRAVAMVLATENQIYRRIRLRSRIWQSSSDMCSIYVV